MATLGELFRGSPWISTFRHPHHAENRDKPIADLGRPHSNMREYDMLMRHGHGVGHLQQNDLTAFIYVPEITPYAQSYTSGESAQYWGGVGLAFYLNWFTSKHAQASTNAYNPRTRWAHTITFWMGLTRLSIAWVVGICGYFYSYEYLYTYVPPFKIRDPSPEGWKRMCDDGQSTYLARTVAAVFPAIGYAIWKGNVRRAYLWFGWCAGFSCYWELSRVFFTGSMLMINFFNYIENDKVGRAGSLTPELERRIDPDTNRPFWIAEHENFRLAHSPIYDEVQKVDHTYQPFKEQNLKLRNPYFSFQKAGQLRRDSPVRYKSDFFRLPEVLEARLVSGTFDNMRG